MHIVSTSIEDSIIMNHKPNNNINMTVKYTTSSRVFNTQATTIQFSNLFRRHFPHFNKNDFILLSQNHLHKSCFHQTHSKAMVNPLGINTLTTLILTKEIYTQWSTNPHYNLPNQNII